MSEMSHRNMHLHYPLLLWFFFQYSKKEAENFMLQICILCVINVTVFKTPSFKLNSDYADGAADLVPAPDW